MCVYIYNKVEVGQEWLLAFSHWINREGTGNEGRTVKYQAKAKRKRMAAQNYKIGKGLSHFLTHAHTPDDHTLNTKHYLFANLKRTKDDRMG